MNLISSFMMLYVLFFVPVVPTFECKTERAPQKMKDSKKSLFGVNLRLEAQKLLTVVENYYGKPIEESRASNWPPGKIGHATVKSDGTPVITMNSSIPINEEDIVHELFHLKLNAEGFYAYHYYESDTRDKIERNKEFLEFLSASVYDPIQHQLFNPEIRKMGLEPSLIIKKAVESRVQSKSTAGLSEEADRAVFYFRAALELNDKKLLNKLDQLYRKNRWDDSLNIGIDLANIIVKAKPKTPEQVLSAYVNCINRLLHGMASFKVTKRTSEKRGKIDYYIAVYFF